MLEATFNASEESLRLTVGFGDMPAPAALSGAILGIFEDNWYAFSKGFICAEVNQLSKTPAMEISSLLFSKSDSLPDAFEILKHKIFSDIERIYKLFTDYVVDILTKPSLLSRQTSQESFSPTSAFGLNRSLNFKIMVSNAFKILDFKLNFIRGCGNPIDTQINSYRHISCSLFGFFSLNRQMEKIFMVGINNLGLSNLPTLISEVLQLKISQYHKHSEPTLNGLKRDDIVRNQFSASRKVQREHFSFNCMLNGVISLIGRTNLILQGYGYLRRKVEFISELIVENVVQSYSVKTLLLPCHLGNPVHSLVAGIKRFLDCQLIGWSWIQFNLYRSCKHIDSIYTYRKDSRKRRWMAFSLPSKERSFHAMKNL